MISPGSTDQERPCVAGAKECVSSPNRGLPEPGNIIPRYIVRVPSDTSEPLKLVKEVVIHKNKMDDSKLSRGVKKTSQCNLANGHQRNEMTAKKLQSSKPKRLGSSNGEQKTNALNTGQPFTSSKHLSVSKEHLMTSSSSGTEPPRTASSSGTEPPRTASFYEHATRSPTETSPSTTYSKYPSAPPRKRISHLTGACTKEKASCSAQRTASSKEAISRRANKTHDSKHQEPPSTSPASRLKLQLNSSNIPSKLGKHPFTTKEGTSSDASGSTKVSARQQVASEWQHSYFPTAIERRHSSGPEEAQRHTSTSQNASELAPHNAAAGLNVAKQKHNFIGMSATPLMKKTKAEAKRLTKDRCPDKVRRSMFQKIYTFES
ncbi:hypothetical protein N1851_034415 [Merluccius polli]|uniref:Uncharacterized protein n=1 Tax=Merluccius polli TaxID=89951 RepID=A0AA47LZN8_MERPO|nr:hypothetical protein N1851_034415 [Merluccius polli]